MLCIGSIVGRSIGDVDRDTENSIFTLSALIKSIMQPETAISGVITLTTLELPK